MLCVFFEAFLRKPLNILLQVFHHLVVKVTLLSKACKHIILEVFFIAVHVCLPALKLVFVFGHVRLHEYVPVNFDELIQRDVVSLKRYAFKVNASQFNLDWLRSD
jgi:hypothetical protein